MKCLKNESLSKHTTIRLGGNAKLFVIPETTDELLDLIVKKNPRYFIGGGSNLLISEREFGMVVDLRSFDSSITQSDDGTFCVGASVRLQKLIRTINEAGYGGIEYLYSVPGLVGGAVVMNAGRGEKYNQCISDYIISVDVIRSGKIITLSKDECGFSYRNSVFKGNSDIVISCKLKFPQVSPEISESKRKERIEHCQKYQDTSKPNFGSVFSKSNSRIMRYVKKRRIGKGNAYFSGKASNWILNDGGTFSDVVDTIKKAELLHKLLFRKCRREVIIWK